MDQLSTDYSRVSTKQSGSVQFSSAHYILERLSLRFHGEKFSAGVPNTQTWY